MKKYLNDIKSKLDNYNKNVKNMSYKNTSLTKTKNLNDELKKIFNNQGSNNKDGDRLKNFLNNHAYLDINDIDIEPLAELITYLHSKGHIPAGLDKTGWFNQYVVPELNAMAANPKEYISEKFWKQLGYQN